MSIRPEVLPHLGAALALAVILAGGLRLCRLSRRAALRSGAVFFLVLAAYLLFFFRDPERRPPADPDAVLAGADGRVMNVVRLDHEPLLDGPAVRISIFLSLFNVHVNRAPVGGTVQRLEYHPGRRYFTFQEKSSTRNQHSTIVIRGPRTTCVLHQIVGPVARRVVYWLRLGQPLRPGDRIGMMKFGSRLDILLPAGDVDVVVRRGDRVRAGETVVARTKAAGERKGLP